MLPPIFKHENGGPLQPGDRPLLATLLPECVAVAEQHGSLAGSLLPEEQEALGRAVARRQIEFAAGRRCAREALHQLGIPPYPILRGIQREPLWPDGVVGSITHCEGFCGAVASFADQISAIGIDAEPDEPLPDGLLPMIARIEEIEKLHSHPACRRCNPDRLLFSAKESTYKAWYPLTKTWLAFDAVRIEFLPDAESFDVVLVGPVPPILSGLKFYGRYLARKGLILTTVLALNARFMESEPALAQGPGDPPASS